MNTPDSPSPQDHDDAEQAVDLSLIHEMLQLSVNERLQQLEDHAALMQELRDANPALRLPKDP